MQTPSPAGWFRLHLGGGIGLPQLLAGAFCTWIIVGACRRVWALEPAGPLVMTPLVAALEQTIIVAKRPRTDPAGRVDSRRHSHIRAPATGFLDRVEAPCRRLHPFLTQRLLRPLMFSGRSGRRVATSIWWRGRSHWARWIDGLTLSVWLLVSAAMTVKSLLVAHEDGNDFAGIDWRTYPLSDGFARRPAVSTACCTPTGRLLSTSRRIARPMTCRRDSTR